jgi:hypothetical protein
MGRVLLVAATLLAVFGSAAATAAAPRRLVRFAAHAGSRRCLRADGRRA